MYNHCHAGAICAPVGALPYTGFSLTWLILAAFALITAGLAIVRMTPRRKWRAI